MLGFDTIGNATLILYDGTPVLATDPWIDGDAYFSSWGPTHEIPTAQRDAIQACKYLWFSHGHPDHSSIDSLSGLGPKEFLLANHRGGRIQNDFAPVAVRGRVRPDRESRPPPPRVQPKPGSAGHQ